MQSVNRRTGKPQGAKCKITDIRSGHREEKHSTGICFTGERKSPRLGQSCSSTGLNIAGDETEAPKWTSQSSVMQGLASANTKDGTEVVVVGGCRRKQHSDWRCAGLASAVWRRLQQLHCRSASSFTGTTCRAIVKPALSPEIDILQS